MCCILDGYKGLLCVLRYPTGLLCVVLCVLLYPQVTGSLIPTGIRFGRGHHGMKKNFDN